MIFIKTIIIQFKYRTPKFQNALDPKRLQNKKKQKNQSSQFKNRRSRDNKIVFF